jgi:hypothetical protein
VRLLASTEMLCFMKLVAFPKLGFNMSRLNSETAFCRSVQNLLCFRVSKHVLAYTKPQFSVQCECQVLFLDLNEEQTLKMSGNWMLRKYLDFR